MKQEQGSMVIEAAIIMPFFLSFMIAMITMVQIAITDMALQSAVSETAKQVAAHMYPAYLLSQTKAGQDTHAIMSQISEAKKKYESITSFADDYAALIPEPIIALMGWDDKVDHVLQTGVNKSALVLLKLYMDDTYLDKDKLDVVAATLPSMSNKQRAEFSLTAEYKLKLLIPFIRKDIIIRKTAYERIWIGN